mgnify:CR=1 FL=1
MRACASGASERAAWGRRLRAFAAAALAMTMAALALGLLMNRLPASGPLRALTTSLLLAVTFGLQAPGL